MLQLCNIRLFLNHPTDDHIKFPSLFCHLTNDKTQTPPQPHQPTQTNTQTAPDRVSSELQLHKFRNKSGFVSMNAHSPDPTCAQVLIFSVTHPRHFGRKGLYNLKHNEVDKIFGFYFPSHTSGCPIYQSGSSK